MNKRQLKKVVKTSSHFLDITIKYESEEDGNHVLISNCVEDTVKFNRHGMTNYWRDIPVWFIPYNLIGCIKKVAPF